MAVTEDVALLERARQVHASTVVVDTTYTAMLTDELLATVRRGGVTALNVTVAVGENARVTIEKLAKWLDFVDRHPDDLVVARSVDQIEQARLQGKVALTFLFQNTAPIEDDITLLRVFKELGVWVIGLTYNERNLVGDGCTERQDSGLSDFGVQVVQEMNRLGLLVDLSHVGDATAREAVEVSTVPVAATHSNARALCDTPRNLPDDLIRAIGAKGGFIGINAFPGFVSKKDGKDQTIDDMLAHLEYIAGMIGIDKIGIGLDLTEGKSLADYTTPDGKLGYGKTVYKAEFYPPWPWVYPVPSSADFPKITEALLRRGYTDDEVRGVLGANFLGLLRRVRGE